MHLIEGWQTMILSVSLLLTSVCWCYIKFSIRKTKKPSREEDNLNNHEDQQLNVNSTSPNQRRFSSARKWGKSHVACVKPLRLVPDYALKEKWRHSLNIQLNFTSIANWISKRRQERIYIEISKACSRACYSWIMPRPCVCTCLQCAHSYLVYIDSEDWQLHIMATLKNFGLGSFCCWPFTQLFSYHTTLPFLAGMTWIS